MAHEVVHAEVDPHLPDGVNLAYDGLSVKIHEDGSIEQEAEITENARARRGMA